MVRRSLLVLLASAIAAALGVASALGKERVEATLVTQMPLHAAPGDQLDVAWTLTSVDEKGRPHAFGAMGVFIRLFSASGREATTGFASGDGDRTGKYESSVIVPEGGIGALAIGLGGITSAPTGTSRSDVYFPVTNSPFPASVHAPAEPSRDPTEGTRTESGSTISGSTWLGLLAAVLVLGGGGLGIALRRHRPFVAGTIRRP